MFKFTGKPFRNIPKGRWLFVVGIALLIVLYFFFRICINEYVVLLWDLNPIMALFAMGAFILILLYIMTNLLPETYYINHIVGFMCILFIGYFLLRPFILKNKIDTKSETITEQNTPTQKSANDSPLPTEKSNKAPTKSNAVENDSLIYKTIAEKTYEYAKAVEERRLLTLKKQDSIADCTAATALAALDHAIDSVRNTPIVVKGNCDDLIVRILKSIDAKNKASKKINKQTNNHANHQPWPRKDGESKKNLRQDWPKFCEKG